MTASPGLNPNDPELRALVDATSLDTARRAALFAAQIALRHNPVSSRVVQAAVEALTNADWSRALSMAGEVRVLAERHDALYFQLLDRSDGEYTPEVIREFGRARALSALAAALQPDARNGALDAVYEAYVAAEDAADAFLSEVKDLLRAPPSS